MLEVAAGRTSSLRFSRSGACFAMSVAKAGVRFSFSTPPAADCDNVSVLHSITVKACS